MYYNRVDSDYFSSNHMNFKHLTAIGYLKLSFKFCDIIPVHKYIIIQWSDNLYSELATLIPSIDFSKFVIQNNWVKWFSSALSSIKFILKKPDTEHKDEES